MTAIIEDKMKLRQLAQEAYSVHFKAGDEPMARTIAEVYKLSLVDHRMLELLITLTSGNFTREQLLEYRAYLMMIAGTTLVRVVRVANTDQQSRLLALPAEMRNKIYRFALVEEDAVRISPDVIRSHSALLQVCRQMRQEASGIFYAEINFEATVAGYQAATLQTARWLQSIGTRNASTICHITVKCLLPRNLLASHAEAKALWDAGDDIAAMPLGYIMTQQDAHAAVFVGSLSGTGLDLNNVSAADSIDWCPPKDYLRSFSEIISEVISDHFRNVLVNSWKVAIRKRCQSNLRKEIQEVNFDEADDAV
ncbi:hypothetical protein CLAFUW4_07499 [Fulvia fulva]|uniref:Uncharacterized protein n=1 Tax=Passalora fulva TaxID=5499 RepID=A0A9Q8PBE7_PASFU|nr:uncharacterized protein CLAFUR5_07629 [Fulvia fulva]KAK4621953.1 hypothetical protein CLAFUR4_07505 [Fulvia fulva]KAK4623201.1 hypothetical protein CLAFUR0_07505 [Fulvia fulva]UJO19372.1 hypothetical protein CLAFUR5_07629 [Fulvia fulva]WPV16799.1 hypothetical protein CLAFUW4_07499 [Fulvia fulva]WPV31764.1 hypothetical protein CLAFUW7_07501 [Fulvia fulva]